MAGPTSSGVKENDSDGQSTLSGKGRTMSRATNTGMAPALMTSARRYVAGERPAGTRPNVVFLKNNDSRHASFTREATQLWYESNNRESVYENARNRFKTNQFYRNDAGSDAKSSNIQPLEAYHHSMACSSQRISLATYHEPVSVEDTNDPLVS